MEKTECKIKVGISYVTKRNQRIRVMAYSEGYWMCRYPKAMPFVINTKTLNDLIEWN